MKINSPQHKAVTIVSVIVIILSVLTTAACLLLMWQPFKEQGAAPPSSAPVNAGAGGTSSEQFEGWDGSFSNFLLVGLDKTNELTDTIMVVGFNNKTGQINVLQIPRDTYAGKNIPTYKYNAIYGSDKKYSGLENLRSHIQNDFGIKIDHYASITTKGLDRLVDSAGGVDLTVPMNMNYDDPVQDLHIHLKKGYQHLNGSQAEQLVRYRHGYTEGDMGRLDTQKLFLAAFSGKLKGMSKIDLTTKVLPVLMSQDNFATDMTGLQMIQFGLAAQKINMSSIAVRTMPGEPFYLGDNSLYSVHKDQVLTLLNRYFVPDGYSINESDMQIEQKADKYTDYNDRGGNFSEIIDQQSGKVSSSSAGSDNTDDSSSSK